MEDKIEVGEYVRTKEGYIGILIEHIPNALNYLKIDVGKEIRRDNGMSDNYIYTRYGFQLKHSKQLIDLIEVGDIIELDNFHQDRCHVVEIMGALRIYDIESDEFRKIESFKIRKILTHEQFEVNCFKVGGKDE